MSSATSWHPDEETMLRLADEDLSIVEAGRLEEHLAGCSACRGRFTELRRLLGDLQRFHKSVVKPALPDPPREWRNPRWSKLAKPFPVRRYLAAAAVVAGAVLLRWIERPGEVSAAELLRRAEAKEQAAPQVRRRIRIRSKNRTWTRPAPLETVGRPQAGDAAALAIMLQDAGFPWEDPLSAASFSTWRNRLPERHDEVRKSAESYLVTTSTPAGVLREASLALRVGDLHAVSATLRYRSDENLDVSEVTGEAEPAEAPRPAAPTPEGEPPSARRASPVAGPAEELRVIAALHDIGADLGDPIDVKRDDEGIVVAGIGLNDSRQEQIRTALAGIPGVRIAFEQEAGRRFTNPGPLRARTALANASNPLIEQLRAEAGSLNADSGDALIDAADRAVQRAHALAALARRFQPWVEASLDATNRATLRRIAGGHLNVLSSAARELSVLLKASPPAAITTPDWQDASENILKTAIEADQELNSSNSDVVGRLARLRAALSRLAAVVDAAQAGLP